MYTHFRSQKKKMQKETHVWLLVHMFIDLGGPALVFIGCCWLCQPLLGFIGIHGPSLAIVNLCWPALGFVGFHWALLAFMDLFWALLAFMDLCWPLLACVGPHWALSVFIAIIGTHWHSWALVGCCWPALAFVRLCWPLLAFIGHHWASWAFRESKAWQGVVCNQKEWLEGLWVLDTQMNISRVKKKQKRTPKTYLGLKTWHLKPYPTNFEPPPYPFLYSGCLLCEPYPSLWVLSWLWCVFGVVGDDVARDSDDGDQSNR